ncbi:MAG: hypothetical protein V3V44_00380 [Anaerolineales bacterium]
MDQVEPSPENSQEPEKSVSKNPFTNLQTMLKGKIPQITLGKPGENFWRSLTVVSVVLNLILIFVLIALGNSLIGFASAFDTSVIDEVAKAMSFEEGATLSTSIRVQDQVPVTLEVPLNRNTVATLSEPARFDGASISIRSATLSIDAPATLTLPAGAELPLALDLSVTVDTVIPIDITVPVEFPIAESEVGDSISAMQGLIEPYRAIVSEMPACWQMLLWGGDCP